MASRTQKVFPLKYAVQQYAWGKRGEASAVAQLKSSADPDFKIDPNATYAELWMGTHPNGPSIVSNPGQADIPLSQWVQEHPKLLGSEVSAQFKGSLPFLFKVLSVRTALSIQAHPNKAHAEILHRDHPAIYKDPNHKPEMAIALTSFVGLCGFRPVQEVAHFLKTVKEFKDAVGESADALIEASESSSTTQHRQAMKCCFKGLMEREKGAVTSAVSALVQRVQEMKNAGEDSSALEGEMVLKLNSEFPGDAGCFAIYFLNIIRLEPGEAMFLEANLPHAYLSGDCIECMACSDNVVRAGLTPKFIDVKTLCEMLDYTSRPGDHRKFLGMESHANIDITIFNPPVPDFGVSRYQLPEGTEEFDLLSFESASICIVVEGEGEASVDEGGQQQQQQQPPSVLVLKKGSVFFMCADIDVHIKTDGKGMLLFRAYAGVL